MLRALTIVSSMAVAQAQTYTGIAGYSPPTNVVEHSEIDLDQKDMETALKAKDYTAATSAYATGGQSVKGSGAKRTIKGMSKDLTGEALFDQMKAYYGDDKYGDIWVSGALATTKASFTSGRGDADFAAVSDDATREQAVKKGTVYLNVWPYAVHELEAAVGKCGTDTTGSLHYLDEAVAFYTGSLVGTDASGDTKGKLMFGLAESRCTDFGTCGGADKITGLAEANKLMFAKFDEYKAAINSMNCAALPAMIKEMTDIGFTPIIQGLLKYAWAVGVDGAGLKYKAEAATFAAAVLPRVHSCSAADAQTIYDNTKIGATSTDFTAVKTAVEGNYACMGVTCAQIGGYQKDGAYKAGFAAGCTTLKDADPLGWGMGPGPTYGIIAGLVVVLLLGSVLVYAKTKVCDKCKKGKAGGPATAGSAAAV